MESYKRLLMANKAWAEERVAFKSDVFTESAKGQSPEFLWIGCADSRVPPETITGSEPGDLFVHRNVANLVVPTDMNLLTVIGYAVDHLKVPNIVVCGHTGCGGVTAAMKDDDLGQLNPWLHHIRDVYCRHRDEVDVADTFEARRDKLVEANVVEQVHNVARSATVQGAWKRGQPLTLHGWVYALETGRLTDLVKVSADTPLDGAYKLS